MEKTLAGIVKDSFFLNKIGMVVIPINPWETAIGGGTQIIFEQPNGKQKSATVLAFEHTQPASFDKKNGILLSKEIIPGDVPRGTKIWKVDSFKH